MKIILKVSFLLVVFVNIQLLSAQQEVQFTQYMYTPSLINPAFVGLKEEMNVSFIHRSQWVGVNGAPVSQSIVFDTPVGRKMGIGINAIRDKIGPAEEFNLTMDASYLLKLNDDGLNFSFGLKGGVQLLNVDFTKLLVSDPNDVSLEDNINSRYSPTIGSGFYLFTEKWYLGLSTPNFLSSKHYSKTLVSSVSNRAHFYFMGGINFDVNEQVKLKPAVLLKAVSGAPTAIDVSLNAQFNKLFTVGVAYRSQAAINALFDLRVTSNVNIGYSYGYETSTVSNFSSGSHEILLRWRVGNLVSGLQQPTWLY